MSRINCHSAFQHYERFHSRGGDVINIGSNNTSIFNFGGSYGSFGNFGGGGFWGGFGVGLGNAVGNLFSGLFGGGMMSPFGMGGMFGGMGNFGFGMNPYSFNYASSTGGGGGSHRVKDDDSNGKVEDKTSSKSCDDPDREKLNKLGEKVNTLEKNPNATRADAQKLYKELVDAQKASKEDEHHTETDNKDYENWIRNLQDYAETKKWGDLSKDEPPKVDANSTGNTGTVPTNTTGATQVATDNTNKLDTSKLTPDDIKNLTPEQVSKLTPDEAKGLLNKLGALNENGDGVKATTNYVTLLLAQQSGLPLSCGHNTSLDNIKGADAYIKGKISDVKLENNIITFSLETNNTKIQIKCGADSTKYEINKTIQNITEEYENATVGTEYEIKQNEEYGTRTGTAAMRRKKA